ncbi:hypothetical protein FEM03_09520 [Phragmitibacter flavus]|uniref:Glycine zipper domain-containing protein n=1 Tax=Phragmitibacter flavus TaxID=2576071 RepID=A0A5R8KHP9_9BACT|nr:glycine zipper domain-containing protein [Phragmitibacter flavus]TLD71139.1 hypothetical protein FEM03_09520 [Phragmitibacter flavus]
MKKQITLLAVSLTAAFSFASCSSGPNARTGTVIGALGGAAAGGIIGHQSGRGLEGAAIGAGAGAIGGNVIGGAQDQRNERYYRRSARRSYY